MIESLNDNPLQTVTFAVFSEAEGNEVLLGLRKGSAKLSPQKGQININNRKTPDPGLETEQTLFIKPVKDEEVSTRGDESEGATYVCPINSCTYMTKEFSATHQTEHYRSKHPDADTVNMQFLTL